jgi:hypothetical protein
MLSSITDIKLELMAYEAMFATDGHDCEEEHAHVREEDGREQDNWNANGDKANEVHSDSRSPMLDTIDKLTEPTVCSLLDGTVELALAKVFPSQKACVTTRPGKYRTIT